MVNLDEQKDSDIRSICKDRIEALEHWLRRIIDELLKAKYGDYFKYVDQKGNRLFGQKLIEQVENRRTKEPTRYPRAIDAILLDDAIDIICRPDLWTLFRVPLQMAFPDGSAEARTFLTRLTDPRNRLAHANPIGIRAAEQVICYSNDVIESLKFYYRDQGMQQQYNVPLILKVTDWLGNVYMKNQFSPHPGGGGALDFRARKEYLLRVGDVITIEIEVDPSFDPAEYTLLWQGKGINPPLETPRIVIPITASQVAESFWLHGKVISKKEWHRLNHYDDEIILGYKVLPPT
jgi:hypothetical protein